METILCKSCQISKPKDQFYLRKDTNKHRTDCKDCAYKKFRDRCPAKGRAHLVKYANEADRKEAARKKAKAFYEKNKEYCNNYHKQYRSKEENKEKIKQRRKKHQEANPVWWKWKKAYDKYIRKCRESSAGPLDLSSVVALESYNLRTFQASSFVCEYCSSIIGSNYELEHIVPLARNGTNKLENLAISCVSCNRGPNGKAAKTLLEWNLKLEDYINKRNKKLCQQ